MVSAVNEVRRTMVLVVDDQPLVRRGLRDALATQHDLEVVASVGGGTEALEAARAFPFELAVIDGMAPSGNGVALTRSLKRLQPHCKVLALSTRDDPAPVADILRAGADGVAIKTQLEESIIEAMREVLRGARYLPPWIDADAVARYVERPDLPLERLTQRERQVFDLLLQGNSNDGVATRLVIARRTVETHRQHIMKKLGVRSMLDLVRLASKHGM